METISEMVRDVEEMLITVRTEYIFGRISYNQYIKLINMIMNMLDNINNLK